MKILHIINSLATGGAEKLIVETLPLLNQVDLSADLLVLNDIEYPYMKYIKGLNCCKVFSSGRGSVYNPVHIFRIIPYLKNYDVIHVHLFPAMYWVVVAKIISFSKIKLVFTEHSTSNRRMQNVCFMPIERFIYSFYSNIVCITKDVKDSLIKHTRIDSNKFVVISNGVNLDFISSVLPISKVKINRALGENDKLLIQIAGFRIEKDQKTTIRAMCYLGNDVKLLFVGDGVLIDECKSLVKELCLQERVLFLGIRTDVPVLLKSVDISIVSSHWEGFGLVAVEGMATSKPVVASNVVGLASLVDGAGILFEKGNAVELATHIKRLLNDEKYYNNISENCYQRSKLYSIEKMISETVKLYKSLC